MKKLRKIGAFGLVAALAAGCAADSPAPALAEEPAPGSAGCGAAPPVAPGTSGDFSMRHGELDREYRLHLPPGYDSGRPTALVLDFHGYTGMAAGEEAYTGLSRHADEHGYAVVYPQGTGFLDDDGKLITSWNDLAGSASPGPEGPICSPTADKYPHPPECGEATPCNYYYTAAEAVMSRWASPGSQDCDPAATAYPTSQDGVLGLACVEHAGCATGAEVAHCTWDGAHDWPQAESQPVGNEVIWEFFARHTRAKYRSAESATRPGAG